MAAAANVYFGGYGGAPHVFRRRQNSAAQGSSERILRAEKG